MVSLCYSQNRARNLPQSARGADASQLSDAVVQHTSAATTNIASNPTIIVNDKISLLGNTKGIAIFEKVHKQELREPSFIPMHYGI